MSFIGTNGGNKATAQALPANRYAAARPKIPQVGLHTSEFPAGHLLLALWLFINGRIDHGSYHGGSDAHGNRNQYAPWSWYTWHAPAINPFAAGLVANCRSDEWDRISKVWRDNLIDGLAYMAHLYSRWCVSQGLGPVPAVLLTAAQARAGAHGFVYHGALQSDRTDPTGLRNVFPWEQFRARFIAYENGTTTASTTIKEKIMSWSERLTSLVSGNKVPAGDILTHAHRAADLAAERVKALGSRVWTFGVRSLVSGDTISTGTVLTYAHLRAHQSLAGVNKVDAKVDALAETLDEVLGGQGRILAAVKAVPEQISVETAEDIAKRLQITVAEVEPEPETQED
ncbi:hypothetical protein [Nesterenkonia rhizosphaerae]|uniref:Lysin A n=1 Tax=Nesterenkonia rhizosphaerae TaxID=1348272 RepID=A0ABP9G062_9MICC